MILLLVLSFVSLTLSQGPPLPTQPPCEDKLPNCVLYGQASCSGTYKQWAETNCRAFCGICKAPEKPCEDQDKTCDAYPTSTCDNPNYAHWAEVNCRYHCRKCSPAQLAMKDALTTTIPPSLCKDKVDCRQYGKSSCSGTYEHWARINCMEFCGFCHGPPTPPHACADTIPTCQSYGKATCSDSKYTIWVQDNCAKYCGLCGGGSGGPGTPPVPIHTVQGPVGPTIMPVAMTPPGFPGKK